jgi:hypothetical protein
MADGSCALERSVRTVGCFTDGHGRDAVAARSPVVTPKPAAFSSCRGSVIGSRHDLRNTGKSFRASKPDLQAGKEPVKITRPHDRGPGRTADHRRRPAARRLPPGHRRHQPARLTRAPGMPRSCCGPEMYLHAPRSYLARAGGRRTRPQPGRSLLGCPGHAELGQRLRPRRVAGRASLPNMRCLMVTGLLRSVRAEQLILASPRAQGDSLTARCLVRALDSSPVACCGGVGEWAGMAEGVTACRVRC